ncbi:hypothetical protein MMC20_002193 [Loxospora ochrophaea]|nr:hypothetical protein [Loxospora ochrophaea]
MATGSDRIAIDDGHEEFGDDGSLLGAESQRSLASSIHQFRYENGRRYHAYREGQYWGPNDDKMNAHEAVTHHLFLLTRTDKLFFAPIANPIRALDIGTGTGMWAQDFADQFPGAEVIGTDLSPVQPDYHPPNLHFEIDDCCSEWTYPENHFDFIHMRCLYGSIADWPLLYKECYDHLAPGGWIEQAEISPVGHSDDGSIQPGDIWTFTNRVSVEAGERNGRTFVIQERMKTHIEAAGFKDVTEHKYKWPIGGWSQNKRLKEIGKWNLYHWEEGLEGWTMALMTRVLGWTYDEVKSWNAELKKALRDRKRHVWQHV